MINLCDFKPWSFWWFTFSAISSHVWVHVTTTIEISLELPLWSHTYHSMHSASPVLCEEVKLFQALCFPAQPCCWLWVALGGMLSPVFLAKRHLLRLQVFSFWPPNLHQTSSQYSLPLFHSTYHDIWIMVYSFGWEYLLNLFSPASLETPWGQEPYLFYSVLISLPHVCHSEDSRSQVNLCWMNEWMTVFKM